MPGLISADKPAYLCVCEDPRHDPDTPRGYATRCSPGYQQKRGLPLRCPSCAARHNHEYRRAANRRRRETKAGRDKNRRNSQATYRRTIADPVKRDKLRSEQSAYFRDFYNSDPEMRLMVGLRRAEQHWKKHPETEKRIVRGERFTREQASARLKSLKRKRRKLRRMPGPQWVKAVAPQI